MTDDTAASTAAHDLPEVSDEETQALLATSKPYTAMLLRLTEEGMKPDARPMIWERGKRNIALRNAGLLPIVCPATDETDFAGVAIFAAEPGEVARILDEDPGVQAGVLTYELHPVFGFPGSVLE